jgi:hypothetical protein
MRFPLQDEAITVLFLLCAFTWVVRANLVAVTVRLAVIRASVFISAIGRFGPVMLRFERRGDMLLE